MVKYDPRILQQFADRLYSKASSVIIVSTLIGVLLGAALGVYLKSTVHQNEVANLLLWGPLALGGFIGFMRGQAKAFEYRLEAQRTLCQLEIESNTRAIEDLGRPEDRAPLQKG